MKQLYDNDQCDIEKERRKHLQSPPSQLPQTKANGLPKNQRTQNNQL